MTEVIREEQYWRTAEGKVIAVADMTESHAKNCLRLMIKRSQEQKRMESFEKRAGLMDISGMIEGHSSDELVEYLMYGTIGGEDPGIPEIFEKFL